MLLQQLTLEALEEMKREDEAIASYETVVQIQLD